MAQISFGLAMACKVQAAGFGTPETFATGGALGLADGIVLGDAGSGIGETGIDFELERVDKAIASVASSFTQQFPTFLRRDVAKLSIAIPAKGHGANAITPADADFDPVTSSRYPGLDALLRSAGLQGAAWGAGVGWAYQCATAAPITVKLWCGSGSETVLYIIQDCVAKMTLDENPGDAGVWTFELSGSLVSVTGGITFPTLTYGVVASTSAPVVASVAHSFGIGAAARGYREMQITIDNAIEDVPDSNQPGGSSKRQTGRTVGLSAVLFADSADEVYEDTRLGASSPTTDDVVFAVGSAATAGVACLAYRIEFRNPNVKKNAIEKTGPSVARKIELEATDTVANTEFALILF